MAEQAQGQDQPQPLSAEGRQERCPEASIRMPPTSTGRGPWRSAMAPATGWIAPGELADGQRRAQGGDPQSGAGVDGARNRPVAGTRGDEQDAGCSEGDGRRARAPAQGWNMRTLVAPGDYGAEIDSET